MTWPFPFLQGRPKNAPPIDITVYQNCLCHPFISYQTTQSAPSWGLTLTIRVVIIKMATSKQRCASQPWVNQRRLEQADFGSPCFFSPSWHKYYNITSVWLFLSPQRLLKDS